MHTRLAIGGHDIEVPHRGQEIEVTVALLAASHIVEGVHRSISPHELAVLIHHHFSNRFIQIRGRLLEHLAVELFSINLVAIRRHVSAVDRELRVRIVHRRAGRVENIGKAHPLFSSDFLHCLHVESNAVVVHVSRRDLFGVLVGNR